MPKGQKYSYEDTHKIVDGVLYKLCNKHNKYFPNEDVWVICNEDYFYINKSNKQDGYNPSCKKCNRARILDDYYNDGGKTKKRIIKAASIRYHTVPSDKEIKLRNGIRQRETGYQAKWLRSKTGKERSKIYNIYRSQHKTHDISKSEWKTCLNYFNNSCAYCGLPADEHFGKYRGIEKVHELHKEHVAHNGSNELNNCIPSCRHCNTSKHTDKLEEWYFKQDFYSKEKYDKIIKWMKEDYKKHLDNINDSKIS